MEILFVVMCEMYKPEVKHKTNNIWIFLLWWKVCYQTYFVLSTVGFHGIYLGFVL